MSSVPNLSSLQGLSQTTAMGMGSALAALRPQGPNLTPGLANHCRQDLLAHVQGWPADVLEKQVREKIKSIIFTDSDGLIITG